jgi:hypothetical protein
MKNLNKRHSRVAQKKKIKNNNVKCDILKTPQITKIIIIKKKKEKSPDPRNKGLASEDRGNKPALLLTAPRSSHKSSTRDPIPLVVRNHYSGPFRGLAQQESVMYRPNNYHGPSIS